MKRFFQNLVLVFVLLFHLNNLYAVTNLEKGQTIYEQYCHICHAEGLMGAPKFRDVKTWHDRFAKKNLNELVSSVIQGINAMPAQGTCYECTPEDLMAAIEYMAREK